MLEGCIVLYQYSIFVSMHHITHQNVAMHWYNDESVHHYCSGISTPLRTPVSLQAWWATPPPTLKRNNALFTGGLAYFKKVSDCTARNAVPTLAWYTLMSIDNTLVKSTAVGELKHTMTAWSRFVGGWGGGGTGLTQHKSVTHCGYLQVTKSCKLRSSAEVNMWHWHATWLMPPSTVVFDCLNLASDITSQTLNSH